MSRFCNVLPLTSIILLLIYAYYAYVIELCLLVITSTVKKIIYLICFHVIFISFFVMSLITACHKKWLVPEKYWFDDEFHRKVSTAWSPEEEYNMVLSFCNQRRLKVYNRSSSGGFRICDICKLLKPDRTHHCSTCKTCVLRMDHHCPWLNNCIGFTNQKYFLVTIVYAIIYCFYYFGTTVEYVLIFIKYRKWEENLRMLNFVITCVLTFVIGWVVLILLIFQLKSLYVNETTLEALHTPTFSSISPLTFNKGGCTNFKDFCGSNPFLWCLPVNTVRGDGTTFEVYRV